MKTRTTKRGPTRCPVCGKGDLRALRRTERYEEEVDHEKVAVVAERVPVEICDSCGEVYSGPAAWRSRDEALRRALGLLTPAEIRALRDRLGLTQAQFAALTGIGEATISRWERGQLIQNRALDRYLRLLDARRENIKLLQKLNGPGNNSPAVSA